jgi:sugar phosphate isomerase/epimerase
MRPGIFAKTFSRPSLEEVLAAVAAHGIDAVQFNLSLAGGPTLPRQIAPELATRIATAARLWGLEMAAVSGTYNMAHPDPAVRSAGADALAELIARARLLDTTVVTLCTGSRDPLDMWRWHPDNGSRDAWRDALTSIGSALEVAERHGVTLAFEPERNNVVDSARAGRRLLAELRSPALKVLLDAANLIQPGQLGSQRAALEEAFDLLGGYVVLAHAKDLLPDGRVTAAGCGGLDYDLYLGLLDRAGYRGPLLLHGLAESEVAAAVAFLRDRIRLLGAG